MTVTVNPAVDTSASTRQVMSSAKIRCTRARYEPGGGGVNVSRAISRLGGTSIASYFRGGYNGELFEILLDKEGINHLGINIKRGADLYLAAYESLV